MKIGIIDIGSNSIRLMMSEDGKTIGKYVDTARLGEGLALTGMLKESRMELARDMIKSYVDRARSMDAERIFIFATEAVRAAKNRDIFLGMVHDATGILIDIVPSEIEAKLGFSGAYSGDKPLAVVDIGGASTEITVGDKNGISYSKSLPIGCVRMRDKCGEDDALLMRYIGETLIGYGNINSVDKAVFVAGTASTVAMMKLKTDVYNVEELDNMYIDLKDIDTLLDLMKRTPMEKRAEIKGLEAGRRDILYGGMMLIRAILTKLHLGGFYFSDRDNLEGYEKYLRVSGKLD